MPYIKFSDKERLAINQTPETPGELNYLVTCLALRYMGPKPTWNYAAINDVLGALEGAKLEFYRRVAAPYEDKKIQENGDVY
jgi:hypothetical protein